MTSFRTILLTALGTMLNTGAHMEAVFGCCGYTALFSCLCDLFLIITESEMKLDEAEFDGLLVVRNVI